MKKQDVADHGARGRVRGLTYADGEVNSPNGSLTDHARTREARRRPFTEAEVAAWRKRIFAETMDDPVKVAVEEAVKLFGSSEDFTIWAWYANRIGVNNFLELYFEQRSVMRHSTLRNPAAAFHMRLKRFYNARFPKAEATGVSLPRMFEATGVSLPRGADNRGSGALAASSRAKGGAA